jgi:hypothetical protein
LYRWFTIPILVSCGIRRSFSSEVRIELHRLQFGAFCSAYGSITYPTARGLAQGSDVGMILITLKPTGKEPAGISPRHPRSTSLERPKTRKRKQGIDQHILACHLYNPFSFGYKFLTHSSPTQLPILSSRSFCSWMSLPLPTRSSYPIQSFPYRL